MASDSRLQMGKAARGHARDYSRKKIVGDINKWFLRRPLSILNPLKNKIWDLLPAVRCAC